MRRTGDMKTVFHGGIHPAGRKELRISMSELAQELQISRPRVSLMLRSLEVKGELKLGREKIEIPAFERLLQSI